MMLYWYQSRDTNRFHCTANQPGTVSILRFARRMACNRLIQLSNKTNRKGGEVCGACAREFVRSVERGVTSETNRPYLLGVFNPEVPEFPDVDEALMRYA